jgi:hypothetical protein
MKKLVSHININFVQTMSSPISPIIAESDEVTESPEPTPSDPPTLAPNSPSPVSDLNLPIALFYPATIPAPDILSTIFAYMQTYPLIIVPLLPILMIT